MAQENKVSQQWEEVIMSHERSVTPLSTEQARQTPEGGFTSPDVCFFFFFLIARARQACLCSTVPLWGSLNRFTWKEIRQSRHYIKKKGPIFPYQGFIFELELRRSNVSRLIFKKRGAGGGCPESSIFNRPFTAFSKILFFSIMLELLYCCKQE